MYLTVNPTLSRDLHPENRDHDFVVELPRPIVLKGEWECALLCAYYTGTIKYKDLPVYCDLFADNLLDGLGHRPTARILRKSEEFTVPYYMKLSSDRFERFRVFAEKRRGQEYPKFSRLTFHLRPVSRAS